MKDAWIVILLVLIVAACIRGVQPGDYECHCPEPTGVKCETVSPTPEKTPEPSACEIENQRLKDDADYWRKRLFEEECASDEGVY